ncbi:MAG: gliding motility-associated C-terminal domain-containing protein [Flavobacteriales bacterium]|nr:gliding motility-associated C-terminal domain-containing protein [Flavobacteriales bacterium]
MPVRWSTHLIICVVALFALRATGQSRFIENRGQWPDAVAYQAELDGVVIWCERDAVVFDLYDARAMASAHADVRTEPPATLPRHAVRISFLSATDSTSCKPESPLPGYHNYFLGSDPTRWASRAMGYGRITFVGIAPGCDAILRANRGGAKYDLVVAPGADPSAIRIAFEGADLVELRGAALVVHTTLGRLTERIPIAYQEIDGEQRAVHCRYTLKDGVIGFKPGAYDKRYPLIIDPTLSFATYSGSFSNNFGYTATFDQLGFLYAGSTAFGNQFPVTMGAYQTAFAGGTGQGGNGGTDIALTKYDTTGSFLVWSTYLGGNRDEMPHSLIVAPNGQLLVLGTSGSANFPIAANGYDNSFGGGQAITPAGLGLSYPTGADMVLARLSADGSALLGSTYLGGTSNDGLNTAPELKFNYADEVRGEVLLDAQGRVWVVSCTQSSNMPTTAGAAQPAFAGGSHDGYVARFDPLLTTLQYASFIGGSGADACYNGDLDAQERLLVCGGTTSVDLPVSATALDGTFSGGPADAFAARFTPTGSAIDALTYWGSSSYDQAYFIELDQNGDAFLFGQTSAPTGQMIQNAPYNLPGGGQFITKVTPDLSAVLLSSRVGSGDGTPDISPTAFLVDVCDQIYTSGWGSSNLGLGGSLSTSGLPVSADAHQATTDGHDLYLAVFDINMQALTYATYYGGGISPEHVDGGTSRFDRRGRVYQSVCAGCQNNDDFPTTPGAWSATNNSSGCNNGVLKFDFDSPLVIAAFLAPDTVCAPLAVSFTNLSSGASSYQWSFGDGQFSTATSPTHTYAQPGTYTVTLTASDPDACNGQDVAVRVVTIAPEGPLLEVMSDTLICGPVANVTLTATSFGSATQWQWSTNAQFTNTLNASPQDSTATIAPAMGGTYFVRAGNGSACRTTGQVTVTVSNGAISLSGETQICANDTATLNLIGADAGSSISWSPPDEILSGQGTSSVNVAPVEQTIYAVQVNSTSGCAFNASITVDVSPIDGGAMTVAVDQSIVVPGTTVQLQATPTSGVSYAWQPAGLVSNPAIANPTALVQQTTWFSVTVSDGICTRIDSVKVTVYELICEEPDIFVPNTFTPNGDGVNDVLFVRGAHIERLEFQVFDRWGERVFRTEDQLVGWNGHYQSKLVDPAVFVYHLKAWCIDGQEYFKKGNVTVVR